MWNYLNTKIKVNNESRICLVNATWLQTGSMLSPFDLKFASKPRFGQESLVFISALAEAKRNVNLRILVLRPRIQHCFSCD